MPQTPTKDSIDQLREAIETRSGEIESIHRHTLQLIRQDKLIMTTAQLESMLEEVHEMQKELEEHKKAIASYKKEIAKFYAPAVA